MKEELIAKLPYTKPFLFVDRILEVSESHIVGEYTFPEDAYFYAGHFKNNPVTPGVILTECMAQIGLVCFGINLLELKNITVSSDYLIALTENHIEFLAAVYPNEKVIVRSEIQYFRMNKLKCKVKMYNVHEKVVSKGMISGILINPDEK